MVGKRIVEAKRVFYTRSGHIDRSVGALVLAFEDGEQMIVDCGSDGDSIKAAEGSWVDPFEGPLSAENEDFVAKAGKWSLFDVGLDPDYRDLIGQRVESVEMVSAPSKKHVGVIIHCAQHVTLRADVESDDLYVQVG